MSPGELKRRSNCSHGGTEGGSVITEYKEGHRKLTADKLPWGGGGGGHVI